MKIVLASLIAVWSVLGVSGQGVTNSGVTPEMRQEANKIYLANDWAKAAAAYEKIVHLEPENPNANYRLGLSFLNLNNIDEARVHLDKAMSASPNPVYALALARAYARAGDKAKAFEVIEKSTKLGGISPATLLAEKDFTAWKDDAAFKDLVVKSDLAVNPCKAAPEFRQFDFWIGEWDVKTVQGAPAGSSSVQLILGQCIVFENWTGGAGSNGKSFNIYDVNDKKWHQSWVDDKGTFSHYVGGIENGEMVVTADGILPNGKKGLIRMTYTKLANGDVRQHGESSADDGKTWATSYDFIYSRKRS